MDPVNIPAKLEVRSFTRSWDNRGYSKNLGRPRIRPRSIFSKILKALLLGWTLWIYLPNLKFVALRVPEIIRGTQKMGSRWIRPRSLFPPIFNGLMFAWTLWVYLPNLKFIALRVPEIIGGAQKIGPSLDTPTLAFLQKFSCACVGIDPVNASAKFAVRSFSLFWDNSDCSFAVWLRTPNLGEGRP